MEIVSATASDWEWILSETEPLGGRQVVSRGVLRTLAEHEALLAVQGDSRLGYAVCRFELPAAELLAIRALDRWSGTGTRLLSAFEAQARQRGCVSTWLCTTNDNLSAIRFYQRRGYRLKSLHAGAFSNVLRIKGLDPEMEVFGEHGIIIRDEMVFEKPL